MKSLGTPHYYIRLGQRLPAEAYFVAVGRLKGYMKARGFELDEFGDTDEADREAVRREGYSDCFEGQVVFPSSEAWIAALLEFLDSEGLETRETRFDD